jgi:hypothetical protein
MISAFALPRVSFANFATPAARYAYPTCSFGRTTRLGGAFLHLSLQINQVTPSCISSPGIPGDRRLNGFAHQLRESYRRSATSLYQRPWHRIARVTGHAYLGFLQGANYSDLGRCLKANRGKGYKYFSSLLISSRGHRDRAHLEKQPGSTFSKLPSKSISLPKGTISLALNLLQQFKLNKEVDIECLSSLDPPTVMEIAMKL